MAKYKIAWLPGDGVGNDVMEAAGVVLDAIELDVEYIHGDIGGEFWKSEGNPLPDRTVDLLKNTDCCLFGAVTSKPKDEAQKELSPEYQGQGLRLLQPHRRPAAALRPSHQQATLQGLSREPTELQGRYRPRGLQGEHRGSLRGGGMAPCP